MIYDKWYMIMIISLLTFIKRLFPQPLKKTQIHFLTLWTSPMNISLNPTPSKPILPGSTKLLRPFHPRPPCIVDVLKQPHQRPRDIGLDCLTVRGGGFRWRHMDKGGGPYGQGGGGSNLLNASWFKPWADYPIVFRSPFFTNLWFRVTHNFTTPFKGHQLAELPRYDVQLW